MNERIPVSTLPRALFTQLSHHVVPGDMYQTQLDFQNDTLTTDNLSVLLDEVDFLLGVYACNEAWDQYVKDAADGATFGDYVAELEAFRKTHIAHSKSGKLVDVQRAIWEAQQQIAQAHEGRERLEASYRREADMLDKEIDQTGARLTALIARRSAFYL